VRDTVSGRPLVFLSGGIAAMPEDVDYAELRDKVVAYLRGVGGKGADTIVHIAKGTGLHRREASKVLQRMEQEGLVQ
jgi:DNA-binding MarR family transcriptional regulator